MLVNMETLHIRDGCAACTNLRRLDPPTEQRNVMSKAQEYRWSAEICLRLAREARNIYARNGLIDLAADFRVIAEETEREPLCLAPFNIR